MRAFDISCCAMLATCLLAVAGCSTSRKVRNIPHQERTVTIQLPEQDFSSSREIKDDYVEQETIVVKDLEGNEVTFMETIVDEEGNEMAHETLEAAKVTARFRNVAERGGNVTIEFEVTVPEHLIDREWQVRFTPDMYIQEDTLDLEPIVITGQEYRTAQLRGYEHYNKFIRSIITDSTEFLRIDALEVFLARNIPEVFRFKTDSSYVSEEVFRSHYGVTQREAVRHYTKNWKVHANDRKDRRRTKMYERYVKDEIEYDGMKLDTLIDEVTGDIIYRYTQSFATRPKLRKVDIVLSGEIYEYGHKVYTVPPTENLTFYISSLNSFTRDIVRYKTRVVERRAEANTSANIGFASGKWTLDESLGNNAKEIANISSILEKLINNVDYDIDSIVVSAAASPEGLRKENEKLSSKRAESISEHFSGWVRHKQDSVMSARGFSVDEDGKIIREELTQIKFVTSGIGEAWDALDELVSRDTVLTTAQQDDYFGLAGNHDLDSREKLMQKKDYYQYLRKELYPKLRQVKFDFHMHRKGMFKDTVHTTTVDSLYLQGVQALRDTDYETALNILRQYDDYNTAVAYCAMDRNASALSILERLDRDAQVNYMLAVIYSRLGRLQEAVQCYMYSCEQDPSYVHRGNLDPEISSLIERYGLNRQEEDDIWDF